MEKSKVSLLFLIHDLGQGGAEKVLVNLVNNLDRNKFDISVIVLFAGGVNEQFLKKDVHFHAVFKHIIPGNSILMKLFSPRMLHNFCVRSCYDYEIAYLEGPSARIISGCQNKNTKLISWIHSMQFTKEKLAESFRSVKEAEMCYERFDKIVSVSQMMREDMSKLVPNGKKQLVLYNTVDTEDILQKASQPSDEFIHDGAINLIATGTLKPVKGFERLLRIIAILLKEGYQIRLYLLGRGPLEDKLKSFISQNSMEDNIKMMGYQINPYRFLAQSDIFVCSSFSEGFSTAVTEAMICGTAICTVDVSGMREMLGNHNEYGVVTENDEDALLAGIRSLLDDPLLLNQYKQLALKRSKVFSKSNTVRAVEEMLLGE